MIGPEFERQQADLACMKWSTVQFGIVPGSSPSKILDSPARPFKPVKCGS
jgi:hypothetical protein